MRKPLSALEAFEADAAGAAARQVELGPTLLEWVAAAQLACDLASNGGALTDVASRFDAALARDRLLQDVAKRRPTMIHDGAIAPTSSLAVVAERLRVHAEAMETHGCFELALTTVSAVCRLTARTDPTAHALATLHLGRIARQMNDWEAAEDAYTSAIGRALHVRVPPIAARGHIGLALLSDMRGNMPEARRHYRKALRMAVPNGGAYLQALQGLMSLAVARQDLGEALLHGWTIYDASTDDAYVRFGTLAELGVVVLSAGFPDAARQGFRHVLLHTDVARLRMIALAGDVRAAAELGDHGSVPEVAAQLRAEIARANQPHESAQALLHLAAALRRSGDRTGADRALAETRALAERHGFHEFLFRAEAMATQWDASPIEGTSAVSHPARADTDTEIPRTTRAVRTGMRRFATLA